jgi:hypothetical protein
MDYELSSNGSTADEQLPNHLRDQIQEAREEAANAIAKLEGYRRMVRKTVIARIIDGTICRHGANDVLRSWGEEPYRPRYNVRMQVDVELTIEAENGDDAREYANRSVSVESPDYELYVHEPYFRQVELVDESEA